MNTEKTSFFLEKTKFCWLKTLFCLIKTAFCMLVFINLFVTNGLYPGTQSQDRKENKQEKREHKSLVMKELLMPPKKSLARPKRNIFIRQRASIGADDFSPPGDFQSPGQTTGQRQAPGQGNMSTESERMRINVQYIGYVQSGKRVVALIILEGQTYAVESGDVLETGVTIGEVTPDDLEIIDPGSEAIRIHLEGEKP